MSPLSAAAAERRARFEAFAASEPPTPSPLVLAAIARRERFAAFKMRALAPAAAAE